MQELVLETQVYAKTRVLFMALSRCPAQVLADLAIYRDTQVSHFNFTNTQLAENFCPKSRVEQAEVELKESSDSAGHS